MVHGLCETPSDRPMITECDTIPSSKICTRNNTLNVTITITHPQARMFRSANERYLFLIFTKQGEISITCTPKQYDDPTFWINVCYIISRSSSAHEHSNLKFSTAHTLPNGWHRHKKILIIIVVGFSSNGPRVLVRRILTLGSGENPIPSKSIQMVKVVTITTKVHVDLSVQLLSILTLKNTIIMSRPHSTKYSWYINTTRGGRRIIFTYRAKQTSITP